MDMRKYPFVAAGKVYAYKPWKVEDAPEINHLISSLRDYVVSGRGSIGDFLLAVLRNDLSGAIAHADDTSMRNLRRISQFIYCNIPRVCWGSKERVDEWLKQWREYRKEIADAKGNCAVR
jgi:hypothetical protein